MQLVGYKDLSKSKHGLTIFSINHLFVLFAAKQVNNHQISLTLLLFHIDCLTFGETSVPTVVQFKSIEKTRTGNEYILLKKIVLVA